MGGMADVEPDAARSDADVPAGSDDDATSGPDDDVTTGADTGAARGSDADGSVGPEVEPSIADAGPSGPDEAPVKVTRLAPGETPPEGAVLLRDDPRSDDDDGDDGATGSDATRTLARRTDTRGPRRARLRALKILFQADLRGQHPDEILARLAEDPRDRELLDDLDDGRDDPHGVPGQIEAFTRTLVVGVHEHRERIDALITRFARRWAISRMPVVDRTVLRMATYELLFEETSPAVVINEAVELAKALSTDDSGRYVNGVLESVRKEIARQARRERTGAGPDAP